MGSGYGYDVQAIGSGYGYDVQAMGSGYGYDVQAMGSGYEYDVQAMGSGYRLLAQVMAMMCRLWAQVMAMVCILRPRREGITTEKKNLKMQLFLFFLSLKVMRIKLLNRLGSIHVKKRGRWWKLQLVMRVQTIRNKWQSLTNQLDHLI